MSEPDLALFASGSTTPVAVRIREARTPFALLRGWMGTDMPLGTALRLLPCSRVHTFGVKCPVDIAHCDRTGMVLQVATVFPNRIGPRVPGTHHVWETRSPGFRNHLRAGQTLTTGLRTAGKGR